MSWNKLDIPRATPVAVTPACDKDKEESLPQVDVLDLSDL